MIHYSKLIRQGQGLANALLKRAATVSLDWDVRQKSRFETTDSTGRSVGVFLQRGQVVRGGDVLLSLLVLPLYVPALVFGAGAVQAEISGLGASAHLSVLAALVLVAAVFSPWASAASLRIALES